MREHHPTSSARGFAAGVNFILLRLFSLTSLYLLIALFEKNEGVFIKEKKKKNYPGGIPPHNTLNCSFLHFPKCTFPRVCACVKADKHLTFLFLDVTFFITLCIKGFVSLNIHY